MARKLIASAVTETYEAVKGTIWKVVRNFIFNKYNNTKDEALTEELFSLGCMAFTEALYSYKPERGTAFNTYVWWKVYYKLLQDWREKCDKMGKWNKLLEGGLPWGERSKFHVRDLLLQLSEDARLVVELLVFTPIEVRHLTGGKDNPELLDRAVKQLLGEIGWNPDKIADVYEEVREALKEERG